MSEPINFSDYRDLFDKVRKSTGWNHEQTRFWFNTPSPLLGNITPIYFWSVRPDKCRNFIASMIAEASPNEQTP